jgi:hypothetical protein
MRNNWTLDPDAITKSRLAAHAELKHLIKAGKQAQGIYSYFIAIVGLIVGSCFLTFDEGNKLAYLFLIGGGIGLLYAMMNPGRLGRAHRDDHRGEQFYKRVKYLQGSGDSE